MSSEEGHFFEGLSGGFAYQKVEIDCQISARKRLIPHESKGLWQKGTEDVAVIANDARIQDSGNALGKRATRRRDLRRVKSSPPNSRSKPSNGEPSLEASGVHFARRLKQLRMARGWSLDVLAKASGVSRSMLSQVERNQANPTLAVAFRIARALGMSLGELAEAPGVTSSLVVIRAADRTYHYRSDADCKIRTLSPLHLEKDVEFYEVQLQKGGALRSAAHFQGTREFLTVQKGRIRVESAADADELGRGDSVTYRADVPHAIVNIGREDAVVFLVDIYQ